MTFWQWAMTPEGAAYISNRFVILLAVFGVFAVAKAAWDSWRSQS
jgi:hypothetical protein